MREKAAACGAELFPGAVWPPFIPPTAELDPDGLPVLVEGKGVCPRDAAGRRCLDGVGTLDAMAAGHGRKRLADVAARQMERLASLDVSRYRSEPELALAARSPHG